MLTLQVDRLSATEVQRDKNKHTILKATSKTTASHTPMPHDERQQTLPKNNNDNDKSYIETINAKGSHAAMPHESIDPIIICSNLIDQMQAIVSRNTPPLESVVLSITQINSGSAYNVIPEEARLSGTIRYFSEEVYALVEDRVKAICKGLETAYHVEVIPDLRNTWVAML